MSNLDKDFNEIMDLLLTVKGVKEHLDSIQVRLGKEILKRRLELGWTQEDVVVHCRELGEPITQSTLSKMESGAKNIKGETYQKVFDALGGIKGLNIEFGELPQLEKKSTRKRALATIS